MTTPYPLLIEFSHGTSIYREAETMSELPILRNGPPGTFVIFPEGKRVSLPTDQIVFTEASEAARVGFGGMSFEGIEDGFLVFYRVRDLQAEELLSPERGRRMTLEPGMVRSISVNGQVVWPRK